MFHRIFVNTAKIFCGSSLNAILNLAAAALIARTIGAKDYGVLIFIQAFALIIGQLLSFNTWQAMITFGSRSLETNDEAALGQLIKISVLLDLVGGLTACCLAMLAAAPVTSFLGWPEATSDLLRLYSPAIILGSSSVAAGGLRLFNRFGLLATAGLASPLIRLAGAVLGYRRNFSLYDFTLVNLVAALSGQLILVAVTANAIGWKRANGFLWQSLAGAKARFPGLLRYVTVSNLHATVKILTREADQVIAAVFINPAALALLKIARQFSQILPMIADPLYQTLFTEFSHLHAGNRNNEFSALIRKSSFAGLSIGLTGMLLFWLFGDSVVLFSFGTEFTAVIPCSMIFMLAFTISLAGLPLQPVMLARGRPEISFKINLISTIIYLTLLLPLSRHYGINGAAGAYVIYYLVWTGLMQARVRAADKDHE